MAKHTIEVTQDDIDFGVRGDSCNCPIARAAKRATGRRCEVGDDSIEIGDAWALLPVEATQFVYDFDDGEPVQPFAFTIGDEPEGR